jgi:hypothetical protein
LIGSIGNTELPLIDFITAHLNWLNNLFLESNLIDATTGFLVVLPICRMGFMEWEEVPGPLSGICTGFAPAEFFSV